MVRRVSARTHSSGGRSLHEEVGTKLGHPTLPMGRVAGARFRLVAPARTQGARCISPLPDRSFAWYFSHLRLSVAAAPERGVSSPDGGGSLGTDERPTSSLRELRRRHPEAQSRQLCPG